MYAVSKIDFHIVFKLSTFYRMAVMGKPLLRERNPGLNAVDKYAMTVTKDSCITISHLS